MQAVTLLSSRTVFDSPRFALVEEEFATPDGAVRRPVIHHPGAVAVLAQPSPAHVLLVRQYRYPIRRWTLEIPAGTRVAGEAPEATAARELVEEAGYRPTRLVELLRFFPAVGVSDEELILYRADGLEPAACAPEHGELVGPEVVALAELPARVRAGELCDAKTLIALALLGVPMSGGGGAVILPLLAATGRRVIGVKVWFLGIAGETGKALIMLARALAYTRLITRSLPQVRRQLDEAGFGSILVLSLIAGLTGMIIAVQTGSALEPYGVLDSLGAIIGATFTREMGPLWAAVIVLARVGASMAAEIGTMTVNEEVDALRAMSIDPVRYLVMPRITALMVIMVLLTSIADFVGMVGGALVSKSMYGVPYRSFMDSAQGLLRGLDIWSGLFKSLVFGVIIGTVACDRGLNTTNGAEGVGRSTTATVVLALVFVLLIDFVLSTVTEKLLRPLLT